MISELRKQARANRGVVEWFGRAGDADLFLSVLTLGEIQKGIESIRRRDRRSAQALARWLRALRREFEGHLLPVDADVAEQWGRLNVPDPMPVVDGLLAATALVHGLTLVTRNVGDVEASGVRVLDPFA